MPVTQERMIALVSAADAHLDAFEHLQKLIDEAINDIARGDDALSTVNILQFEVMRLRGELSRHLVTIGIERAHFKVAKKKNLTERRRIATKRLSNPTYSPPTTKPERTFIQRSAKPVVEEGTARIGDHFIQLDPTSMDQPPKPGDDLFGPSPKGQSEGPAEAKPPKPDWCPSQAEWDEYLATSGGPPELEEPKP